MDGLKPNDVNAMQGNFNPQLGINPQMLMGMQTMPNQNMAMPQLVMPPVTNFQMPQFPLPVSANGQLPLSELNNTAQVLPNSMTYHQQQQQQLHHLPTPPVSLPNVSSPSMLTPDQMSTLINVRSYSNYFTNEETDVLLSELEKLGHILLVPHATRSINKQAMWTEIAEKITERVPKAQKRTADQVRKKWDNMTSKTRRLIRKKMFVFSNNTHDVDSRVARLLLVYNLGENNNFNESTTKVDEPAVVNQMENVEDATANNHHNNGNNVQQASMEQEQQPTDQINFNLFKEECPDEEKEETSVKSESDSGNPGVELLVEKLLLEHNERMALMKILRRKYNLEIKIFKEQKRRKL